MELSLQNAITELEKTLDDIRQGDVLKKYPDIQSSVLTCIIEYAERYNKIFDQSVIEEVESKITEIDPSYHSLLKDCLDYKSVEKAVFLRAKDNILKWTDDYKKYNDSRPTIKDLMKELADLAQSF